MEDERNLPFEAIQHKYQEKVFAYTLERAWSNRDIAEDWTVNTFVLAYRWWGNRFPGGDCSMSVGEWLQKLVDSNHPYR